MVPAGQAWGLIGSKADIAIIRPKMKELYTNEIMSFAAHIPYIGALTGAQGTGTAHSKLCGSRITVWLDMDKGVVSRFSQQVKACLVGQASASMLGSNIIGCSLEEIVKTREKVRQMLEEDAQAPSGKWQAYGLLIPVRNYKSRFSTVLIAFDAVIEAMKMALENRDVKHDG